MVLYITYFLYIAARVLRDFSELIVSFIFTLTPIEVIAVTMMMLICYMIYLGIEVMGRTSEIFVPYFLTFILVIGIAVMISGQVDIKNLAPVLGDGLKPITKAIFPGLLTFPFGEMIAFMMMIPYATKAKRSTKTVLLAVAFSGVSLAFNSMIQITTLGVSMKSRSNFPLLSTAREISLLEFIERVDLIVVFIVMLGIIIKVSVFFFGTLKGLELLTNRPYRLYVLPVGSIIAFLSIKVSDNFAEHIEEGLKVVPMYIHLPFQIGLPLILLPVLLWKTKRKEREQ